MKKYSLLGLLGLIILGSGAAFRLHTNTIGGLAGLFTKTPPSLMSILPSSVDQVMHVRITPETKAFLLQSNKELDPTAFNQVIDTIEEIIIAQAPNGATDVYSIIVLKGKENFSIDKIKNVGLLYAETGYVSQELTPGVWLYGDPASVNWYKTPQTSSLTDKPELKTILTTAAKQQASVLFYSTPGTQLGNDPIALAFASKLQYTALYGTPGIDSSKGSFVLQFTGTNFTRSDTVFTPKHDNQITERTVLYLEGKELLSTFGVSTSQFSTTLPLLLGNMPGASALLTSEQISNLYAGLNSNIGIILDVTETALGAGLRLSFNDPKIYDSLTAVQPLLRGLISPLAGSGTINEQRTENNWTLSVELNPTQSVGSGEQSSGASISFPLLTLDKDADTTTLNILPNPIKAESANKKLMYSADSLLTLRYDPAVLMENAKLNPFLNNFVNQLTLLGTGALIANIIVDDNTQQLIATFESK